MTSRSKALSDYIIKQRSRKETLKQEIDGIEKDLETTRRERVVLDEVNNIVKEAANRVQSHVKNHISEIVSSALQDVMGPEYGFKVDIADRRGRTEVDFKFTYNDFEYNPATNSGGGALEVASLALRLAFMKISDVSPIVLMDEPINGVSTDSKQEAVLDLIPTLAQELDMQFIIVTHLPELAAIGDHTHEIS